MNDPMLPLPGLSSVSGKPVVVKFDGALLSSDRRLLALREIEGRLRVADRLAAYMVDPRAPDQVTHSFADIVRFRLLMIAAGHEDGIDANALRSDPVRKMALDLASSDGKLCSQSTISRLEDLPDVRALLRMGRAMVDLYRESFACVPKRITFDVAHGGQQLSLFNAHYGEYEFQPIARIQAAARRFGLLVFKAEPMQQRAQSRAALVGDAESSPSASATRGPSNVLSIAFR